MKLHYAKPGKSGRGPRARCGAANIPLSRLVDRLQPNVCSRCHFLAAQSRMIYHLSEPRT